METFTEKSGYRCSKQVSSIIINSKISIKPVDERVLIGTHHTISEEQPVPYQVVYQQAADMYSGETKVITQGINGSQTTIYDVSQSGDEPEVKSVRTVTLTQAPVDQVIRQGTGTCDPNYSPCIPYVRYDLNCPDIGIRVRVIGTDHYRLDADQDGYGCDSY